MYKKQIKVSSKAGRSRSGRKWRRQANERLSISLKSKSKAKGKKVKKDHEPMTYKTGKFENTLAELDAWQDIFGKEND
jgi:hypothetical protein